MRGAFWERFYFDFGDLSKNVFFANLTFRLSDFKFTFDYAVHMKH